jgi:dCMP deaminase
MTRSQFPSHLDEKWDRYYYNIACAVAANSPCLSRRIGAVIVVANRIAATGYNGPPERVHHCGTERYWEEMTPAMQAKLQVKSTICPRRQLGYASGEGLDLCPAVHAEANAIATAALTGVSVNGGILYMNDQRPCKSCIGILINAGISQVVVTDTQLYDSASGMIGKLIKKSANIIVRQYMGWPYER